MPRSPFCLRALWMAVALLCCASCKKRGEENAGRRDAAEPSAQRQGGKATSPSALDGQPRVAKAPRGAGEDPAGGGAPGAEGNPQNPRTGNPPAVAGGRNGDGRNPGADPDSRPPSPTPNRDPSASPDTSPPVDAAGIADFESWRERYAGATDPKQRLEFFALSSTNKPPYVEEMVRIALADDAEPIRAEAMQTTSMLADTERIPLLVEVALGNDSAAIRGYAMDDIFLLPSTTKAQLYHQLLDAEYPDVRTKAANHLANISTPQSFELLLDGLSSGVPEQREHVSGLVEQVVGQRFDDRASAVRWWADNRGKFDETMSPD